MSPSSGGRGGTLRWGTGSALALLVLASVVAGCIGPDTEPAALDPADKARDAQATSFSMNLTDIPDGSEWLLIEVSTDEPSRLRADLETDVSLNRPPEDAHGPEDGPQDPQDACVVGQLGFGTLTVLDPIRYGASARVGNAPGISATTGWPGGEQAGHGYMHILEEQVHERVPVLFGIDDVDEWRDDVELSLHVDANVPMDWRIVDHGEMTCTTQVEDFQDGDHVQAHTGMGSPDPVFARDLSSTHEIEQLGVGFVFLQANVAYHARVLEDGEVAWEVQGEPGGSFDVIQHRLNVSRGPVEIQVPELVSTDAVRVGYVLLDLPAWAADWFVEEPLEFNFE